MVAFLRALEAVKDALSGGESRAQGAGSVRLARGRSRLLTGVHVCGKGAASTGVSLWKFKSQTTRGYAVDSWLSLGHNGAAWCSLWCSP